MAVLYADFLYPLSHYRQVLTKSEFVFDMLLPMCLGIIALKCLYSYDYNMMDTAAIALFNTIITFLSILIGFTISSIAILTSSIDKLTMESSRTINGNSVSLYQLTNISLILAFFSEIFTLSLNLVAVLVSSYDFNIVADYLNIITSLNVLLIAHVVLINIRNMTNFYFILHVLPEKS